MRWFGYAVVALLTAVFTVLCGLRWGLPQNLIPDNLRFAFPLLPLAVMLLVCWRWPAAMPSWLAFVCGLTMDLLTQSPMGYWTLVYLSGLLAAKLAAGELVGGFWGRVGAAVGSMLAIVALQAAIDWLFLMEAVAWMPIATSVAAVAAVMILIDLVVTVLSVLEVRPSEPVRMGRGGS